MLGNVGTTEIVVVLAVLLLLFGGKKLPELAKGMGEALKEFKESLEGKEKNKDNKKE